MRWPGCSISRDLRREDHTIRTAVAPDAVFTVRRYGNRPLYGPRLVRKFNSHKLQTHRSSRRAPHEPAILSQLGIYGWIRQRRRAWRSRDPRSSAYDGKIRSMISAPVAITGRSSRR
jgi:hypothetical protein